MTRKNMPRRGRQAKAFKVGEEFRIAIHLTIKNFRLNENEKEYVFPSSFTSTQRGYVHKYCQQLGLRTKSRGQGSGRFLTVYKKEGSTIVQADAVFELGHASQRHALNLLQRFPITPRERQELLPPTERDRNYSQETLRDVNRCMGRLSSGIPMVPPRRCENEYTSFRQNLPIWSSREEIIQMISCHQTVLISGETGSGKTTQVPQYILEHHCALGQPCRIICTEPRRIAALTMAERVSLERDEKVGQTVGYQMRLESRISPKTLLTFCTTGVLLRTLMGGDASIATVTHIIVDELHERDRLSDFLLIVLRDLLLKFRNLKIVLMSASVDIQLFCKYFSNCPLIEVPGRAYDVKAFFLEEILKGTGYESDQMIKHKRDLKKQKASKLDSWCSIQVSSDVPDCASTLDKNSEEIHHHNELNLDELSLNSAVVESELVELEPHLAAAMDKIMEELWMSGSDDFSALMLLMLTEKISVDYQHSETKVSALMLAAGRGNIDITDQLLSLGASLHLKSANGWTAIEWASNFKHKDCEELLAGQCNYDYSQDVTNNEDLADMTEEDKLLVEAYTLSIEENKIDYDLILCLLERICKSQEDGAVLIFLPGYDDIMSLRERIDDVIHGVSVLPLHSQMQSVDQKGVFRPAPPGLRKIVLSTNIAETSITINDVVFVIDCGKVKEKTYDALMGASQLKAGWISKASAIQRRGRAGRCRPGICYHMYSKPRFNSFQKFQVPEILRTPIHELCLQAKLLAPPNAPIADFLAKAPDPPPFMVTRNAVTLLKTIDALDPWEELTELGLHLLDLPIEPRLGKMVLYSVVLKCLDPVLTIVSCLAYRDPFILPTRPTDKRAVCDKRRYFANDTFSDHMVVLKVFQDWQREKPENRAYFCKKNFLSHAVLEMIAGMRSQMLGQLRASGFVRVRGSGDIRDLNTNSEIWAVVKAALCAGTYPNLIRIDRDRHKLITQKESKVRFHHTSVLNTIATMTKRDRHTQTKKSISDLPCDWLIYEEMMRTGSTAHAYCCTLITPITIALFSGPARLPLDAIHEPNQDYTEEEDSGDDSKYDNQKAMFKIDDWISFRVDPEIARIVLQLRQKWHALFLKRMHNPSKPLVQADEAVIRTICGILMAEDLALNLLQPTGIGQRLRPMDHFSLSDIGKSAHNSPSHRNPNYSNYFSPNDIFNPNVCFTDDHHFSASASGANNFNVSYGNCSPTPGPVPQSFNSSQQMSQIEMNASSACNYRIAYFIIKANTSRVVEISMAKNIFAFSPVTERKLLSSAKEGKTVILIFSIQGSGHFQGFARFTPHLADHRPQEFCTLNIGTCYQIEWLKKANVPFQSTRHLQNAWNENRKVQSSRDGQELEPTVGESLCQLIANAQSVFPRENLKANRRPMNYGRDNFPNDSGPLNRSQMQWDMHNPGSSGNWFDSSEQKYWSQSNM